MFQVPEWGKGGEKNGVVTRWEIYSQFSELGRGREGGEGSNNRTYYHVLDCGCGGGGENERW